MDHFFSQEWREGNFLIPVKEKYREELLVQMKAALASDLGQDVANASAVKVLRQRIAAIKAYNNV